MGTFWTTLHVIAVVLVTGPMVAAPFFARRAISRRNADGVRAAARQLTFFGAAAAVAAAFGVIATLTNDRYHLRTPWVIISITLFLLALTLAFLYTAPALAKAARVIAEGDGDGEDPSELSDEDRAADADRADRARTRLDVIGGRVGGSGLLILLVFVVITVLMVVKPFD